MRRAVLAAVAAVYVIGSMLRSRDPILVLVLAGVVIGALLGAGVGLVKYLADPYNQLPAMTFWLLGRDDVQRRVEHLRVERATRRRAAGHVRAFHHRS